MNAKRVLAGVSIVFLFLALWTPSAQAHTWPYYFVNKWYAANGFSLTQNWRFMANVPGGGFRDRVKQGVGQWNAQGQPLQFVYLTGDYGDWQSCESRVTNAVRYAPIDGAGGVLAQAHVCYYEDIHQITNVLITFDSAEPWNPTTEDSNDPGPFGLCINCEVDVWGVAAHEWGHATGFLHLDSWGVDPVNCNQDSLSYHTMCGTYYYGSDRERTLEVHDYHTFNTAY